MNVSDLDGAFRRKQAKVSDDAHRKSGARIDDGIEDFFVARVLASNPLPKSFDGIERTVWQVGPTPRPKSTAAAAAASNPAPAPRLVDSERYANRSRDHSPSIIAASSAASAPMKPLLPGHRQQRKGPIIDFAAGEAWVFREDRGWQHDLSPTAGNI